MDYRVRRKYEAKKGEFPYEIVKGSLDTVLSTVDWDEKVQITLWHPDEKETTIALMKFNKVIQISKDGKIRVRKI